jgi:xanthine dehydrogenase large subunit
MSHGEFKTAQKLKITHEAARAHVSGTAEYVDDRPFLKGEVVVDVYYSPYAHAEILSIDTKEALQVEGILGIYGANELRTNLWGNIFHDQPFLADKIVQYAGEVILVIAAENHEAILKAKKKIKIEFKELKPVLSIREARDKKLFIGPCRKIEKGEVEKAMASAPHRIKGVIEMAGQDHFYLESQACVVYPKEDGQIEIHASSQHPSEVQQLVAEALGLKFNQVICIVKRMGGGFGGKESQAAPFAVYASMVALKLKRPARLILTKDDDMQITGKRNPFENEYEVGFDDNGKILAMNFELYSDGGAYADLSTAIMERAMLHSDNAYYVPNMRVTGQVCKTNTAPNTAFRGFGGPKGMVTVENIIEEIALTLGRDALDIRELNVYKKGQTTHYGQEIDDNVLPVIFSQLRKDSNYDRLRGEIENFNAGSENTVKGLSLTPIKFGISFTTRFLNQANALVNVLPDGTVQVSTGATEMGQGVNTKIAQVVSDSLGISIDDVRVMPTSTEKNSNTSATAASSGSDLNGRAAEVATENIKARLSQVALQVFSRPDNWRGRAVAGAGTVPEIKIDETKTDCKVLFENNEVIDPVSGKRIAFKDLLEEAYLNRVSLSGYGFYRYPGIFYNKETGQGKPFFYFTNGVAVSEVIVDRYTGEIKVLRSDLLMDLGRVQIQGIDHGQVTGAFVQGMGWVTTEKLYYNDKGQLKTFSPSTYKIPSVHDIPREFKIQFIENPLNERNVKGSKAVGEPPLMLAISVWTAVKNALAYDARKKNKTQKIPKLKLPATQEAVLMSLES